MAHYAFLDSKNKVIEVIVGVDENELIEGETPEIWYGKLKNTVCVRTSYNSKIRKNFAGIGYTYDSKADAFYPPQPYPSWSLDASFKWQPPVAYPEDGKLYTWNETDKKWDEING